MLICYLGTIYFINQEHKYSHTHKKKKKKWVESSQIWISPKKDNTNSTLKCFISCRNTFPI